MPIAVCKLARAGRRPVLKAEADDGDGAAKRQSYSGLKAPRWLARRGVAVGLPLTPANLAAREAADAVRQAMAGLVRGAKGYRRPQGKADGEVLGIELQTPGRPNLKEPRPRGWLKLLQRLRPRSETVISQVAPRFG